MYYLIYREVMSSIFTRALVLQCDVRGHLQTSVLFYQNIDIYTKSETT